MCHLLFPIPLHAARRAMAAASAAALADSSSNHFSTFKPESLSPTAQHYGILPGLPNLPLPMSAKHTRKKKKKEKKQTKANKTQTDTPPGLPLGGTGIRPRPMGLPAIRALGRPVCSGPCSYSLVISPFVPAATLPFTSPPSLLVLL